MVTQFLNDFLCAVDQILDLEFVKPSWPMPWQIVDIVHFPKHLMVLFSIAARIELAAYRS